MEQPPAPFEPDPLVRDLAWLGRLARRIVQDPGLADDAVQEAWMRASRSAKGGEAPARSALAAALRGILKQSWRTERRRHSREREAARPESLLSAEEIALIGERQQMLWRHLAALREPFRTTLIRRFQQGTRIDDLAAEEGVSADAVRWRIRRGLEMLRESVRKEGGEAGLAGLVPLAILGSPPAQLGASAYIGAALMKKTLATLACAIAAILLGGFAVRSLSPARSAAVVDRSPKVADIVPERAANAPGTNALAALDRAPAVRTSVPAPSAAATVPTGTTTVTGRLVDPNGTPLAGIDVRMFVGALRPNGKRGRKWEFQAKSGADGRFELTCPRGGAQQANLIAGRGPHVSRAILCFGTGAHCQFPPLTTPRIDTGDVELEPAGTVRGLALDGEGAPIEGATVHVLNVWDGHTVTGPGGEYELTGIPAGRRYVRANFAGHTSDGTAVAVVSGEETTLRDLVLLQGGVLHGQVVDPDGQPIGGAKLDDGVFADQTGHFALPVGGAVASFVRAVADGYRSSTPASFELGAHALITLHPLGSPGRFVLVDAVTGNPVASPRMCRVVELPPSSGDSMGSTGIIGGRDATRSADIGETPPHWDTVALPLRDGVHVIAHGYVECTVPLDATAFDGGVQRIALEPVPLGPLTGVALLDGEPLEHARVDVLTYEELDLSGDRVMGGHRHDDGPVWRIRTKSQVFTDAEGRFSYRGELCGPVQAVVHLGAHEALVSARVQPTLGEVIDLGELPRIAMPTLVGILDVNRPLPAELSSGEFATVLVQTGTEVESREAIPLGGDGTFRIEGLLPGRHALRLRMDGLGEGWRGRIYLVDVPAVRKHSCALNVDLPEIATIDLHLTVNGSPWERGYMATLVEKGQELYQGIDFSDSVGPDARATVPAHRDYRLVLDLGLSELNGIFEPAVDVPCPRGVTLLKLDIETSELMLTLPPAFDPKTDGWVCLDWTDGSGARRLEISSEERLSVPFTRADTTIGRTVRFVSVPVDVKRARVLLRPSGDDDDAEPTHIGDVELGLSPGAVIRVSME